MLIASGLFCGMLLLAALMYALFGMVGVYLAPAIHFLICCLRGAVEHSHRTRR